MFCQGEKSGSHAPLLLTPSACGGRRHVGRAVDIHPVAGLVLLDDHDTRIHLPAETSTIVEVNGFYIRGSGLVDDIRLRSN